MFFGKELEDADTAKQHFEEIFNSFSSLKESVEQRFTDSEKNGIIIRYIETEANALAASINESITMSAQIAVGLINIAQKLPDADYRLLSGAAEDIRSGNLLLASNSVATLNDTRLNNMMNDLAKQWQTSEKVLHSYFTKREIKALSEKIPFIHNDTFSYYAEHVFSFKAIELADTIRETVQTVAKQVEAENLIELVLNCNQKVLSFDDIEESLFGPSSAAENETEEDMFLGQGYKR